MELTPENINYLQRVAAHDTGVDPQRPPRVRVKAEKGIIQNGAANRFLCRVGQDGQQRTKVFSTKRYKSMAAAEAAATEFVSTAHS